MSASLLSRSAPAKARSDRGCFKAASARQASRRVKTFLSFFSASCKASNVDSPKSCRCLKARQAADRLVVALDSSLSLLSKRRAQTARATAGRKLDDWSPQKPSKLAAACSLTLASPSPNAATSAQAAPCSPANSLKDCAQAILTVASGSSATCLLYTSPSPRDRSLSRMPSSA